MHLARPGCVSRPALIREGARNSKTQRSFLSCRLSSHQPHRRYGYLSSASTTKKSSSTSPPFSVSVRNVGVASASLAVGYILGRLSAPPPRHDHHDGLPSGLPRTCCDENENATTDALTPDQKSLPGRLARIVGPKNIFSKQTAAATYFQGARMGGGGSALCVVTPTSLLQVKRCVQAIVDSNCVMIIQGANTGLTGGSVPRSGAATTSDGRPVVLLSMKQLTTIFPIDGGNRVVCLAGAGLADLNRFLQQNFPGRDSHSTLGSTFLNPTTAAGIALGSGGTQCRKGSAYTDRALYIRVYQNKWKENVVEVVNTLGIDGIEDDDFPYQSGSAMEQVDVYQKDVREGYARAMATSSKSKYGTAMASDVGYAERLCHINSDVSRCNADTRGEDCNRSEGKVLILATVHDTFPKPESIRSFWLSFDSLERALAFRKDVCLQNADDVPMSMEYMDRDSFDVIDRSGRVLGNLIKFVGTSSAVVRSLWSAKLWIESLPFAGAPLWCDRLLYKVNPVMPATLPRRMMEVGRSMDHHVAMTVGEFGSGNMERLLDRVQTFASTHGRDKIVINECESASDSDSLAAFRFVAAPAFRTWCVGQGLQGFSVDYALPKNGGKVPSISTKPVKRMRYSHFGCNVLHEDLAYSRDVNIAAAKMELKMSVERDCRGKLPAEHGHGIEYVAPTATQERWKKMDPLNMLNPGIGGLSDKSRYKA